MSNSSATTPTAQSGPRSWYDSTDANGRATVAPMVLNDKQIALLCGPRSNLEGPIPPMIEPFVSGQVRREFIDPSPDRDPQGPMVKVISYGLSSFGYDARLADELAIVVAPTDFIGDVVGSIDPKDFDADVLVDAVANPDGSVTIPPHGFALARTLEYFRVPDDVVVICLGKSTYARCGLIVNVTPLEPGWEGSVTLELSNTTPLPVKVWPREGICQFVFFRGQRPSTTYASRPGGPGKYQGQKGITLAKL